ncbi:MAG TPA: DUF6488 family protein [Caulobacteraceae bacterium]|jgi:hypothetical protein
MKVLICSLFAASAVAFPAVAHPPSEDGSDPHEYRPALVQVRPAFTAAAAQVKAKAVVGTLIERKVVGTSWRAVAPAKAELQGRADGKRWVVTFRNPKERARAKRTLYVFLNESGDYVAANHTGA